MASGAGGASGSPVSQRLIIAIAAAAHEDWHHVIFRLGGAAETCASVANRPTNMHNVVIPHLIVLRFTDYFTSNRICSIFA